MPAKCFYANISDFTQGFSCCLGGIAVLYWPNGLTQLCLVFGNVLGSCCYFSFFFFFLILALSPSPPSEDKYLYNSWTLQVVTTAMLESCHSRRQCQNIVCFLWVVCEVSEQPHRYQTRSLNASLICCSVNPTQARSFAHISKSDLFPHARQECS